MKAPHLRWHIHQCKSTHCQTRALEVVPTPVVPPAKYCQPLAHQDADAQPLRVTLNKGYTEELAGLVGGEPPFKTPAPECTLRQLNVHSVAVVLVDGHPSTRPVRVRWPRRLTILANRRVGVWRSVRANDV